MLIALLTDVHANREALIACLSDAERAGAQRHLFLGDIVGYGADPGFAVDTVRDLVESGTALAVQGNHDAAVGLPDALLRMNGTARAAIVWTRGRLDAGQRAFLAALPLTHRDGTRLYTHANAWSPGGGAYIEDPSDARRSLLATDAQATFVGHLHVPGLFGMGEDGEVDEFDPPLGARLRLADGRRWLARLGAVGQPRDGDPRAAYALLDEAAGVLTFRRVPYDVERAARRVREAGLPESLAARLLRGS